MRCAAVHGCNPLLPPAFDLPLLCLQVQLSKDIKDFIRKSTSNYGKVKLVLQRNSFFVESKYPEVLRELLRVRLNMTI